VANGVLRRDVVRRPCLARFVRLLLRLIKLHLQFHHAVYVDADTEFARIRLVLRRQLRHHLRENIEGSLQFICLVGICFLKAPKDSKSNGLREVWLTPGEAVNRRFWADTHRNSAEMPAEWRPHRSLQPGDWRQWIDERSFRMPLSVSIAAQIKFVSHFSGGPVTLRSRNSSRPIADIQSACRSQFGRMSTTE
jgi:hypothetical protein